MHLQKICIYRKTLILYYNKILEIIYYKFINDLLLYINMYNYHIFDY
jgi:hypothetical protein